MKTTIDINDALFHGARQLATDKGTTLRALVEEGLRMVLERGNQPPAAVPFKVRVFRGVTDDAGLVAPYDRLGLNQAILDSIRPTVIETYPVRAVHDRD